VGKNTDDAVAEMCGKQKKNDRNDGRGIAGEEIGQQNQRYLEHKVVHHGAAVERGERLVSEEIEIEKQQGTR
jgi:hypothetical protein